MMGNPNPVSIVKHFINVFEEINRILYGNYNLLRLYTYTKTTKVYCINQKEKVQRANGAMNTHTRTHARLQVQLMGWVR